MHIKGLLHENTEEMRSILRALNGEYIEPQAGGDLLRDGAGVLPTGGSFFSFIFVLSRFLLLMQETRNRNLNLVYSSTNPQQSLFHCRSVY